MTKPKRFEEADPDELALVDRLRLLGPVEIWLELRDPENPDSPLDPIMGYSIDLSPAERDELIAALSPPAEDPTR